ncbi:class I SAM-dependent methyltransferase [Gaopeijia maritima]|uniref:Class I SAM-dependent methyltransferase n=1 Tax=Gaopeijia maritima TaxID=3119007 RepID=A0ABU9E6D6_9BACT
MDFYRDLAEWWPLFSTPEDYAEEASFYLETLQRLSRRRIRTLLELGSGGGNNASHMKAQATLTLVEPAEGMRAVSEALNPSCEHLEGDMRTIRLRRTFDAVFVHDAVCYMTSLPDLRQAVETAFVHCAPGGAALFAPDYTRETFRSGADDGGEDGTDGRALRYLEWTWDPDPDDESYVVDYAFMLRASDGSVRVVHDRHVEGIFPRASWLTLLGDAGFEPHRIPFEHSAVQAGRLDVFVGVRPEG